MTETITEREPIPEIAPELEKPELPENIQRLIDALDSAWSEQVTLVRLLNAINYPIYETDGVATPEQLQHMQRLTYDVLRYSGYVEQQLRYTLYIMGHDTSHTVSVKPVPPPEPEVVPTE